ncbi:hypothetical protein [Parasitella parasitica]|uniref:Uncharacterized protein n=1 Tax=Parasitella parasitica TaxID=35722 RepID=A0A0B7NF32_9FUNG|nr:hypothetical protein [Parasitella parasitica]
MYLGYPICSSKLQQHNFVNEFITNLKQFCHLHLHRNITFWGRVTVLNHSLYFELWHVMSLFTFTKAQLSTIQQIGGSVVNHGSKVTRFSFATLTLPRAKGGLSRLNPTPL